MEKTRNRTLKIKKTKLGMSLQVCRHSQTEGLGIQPIETLSATTTSLLISDGAKNKSGHAEFISASFQCGIKTSKLVRFRNKFGMTKKNLSGAKKRTVQPNKKLGPRLSVEDDVALWA